MKTIKFLLLALAATVLSATTMTSCTDYQDEIDGLDTRVTALEKLTGEINTNLTALTKIVKAMDDGDYITNVTKNADGCIITFAKAGAITIKDGKDGVDAQTPVITIDKDADGYYYWKLGGEWMTPRVRANGIDGQDATSPQVRINTTSNEWEISTDGGSTWTSTGVKATGKDGVNGSDGTPGAAGADAQSPIKSVVDGTDFVTITLSDDSVIKIPKSATPAGEKIKLWFEGGQYNGTLLEGHTGYISGTDVGISGTLNYDGTSYSDMTISVSGNNAIISNNKEIEGTKILDVDLYQDGGGVHRVRIMEPSYGFRFNDAITMGNQTTVLGYTAWPEAILIQPLYSTIPNLTGHYLDIPDIDKYCKVLPEEDYTNMEIESVYCRLTSEDNISQSDANAALSKNAYLEKHNDFWLLKLKNDFNSDIDLGQRNDIHIVYYKIRYYDKRGTKHAHQFWATYKY